jgi:hypothetical protein
MTIQASEITLANAYMYSDNFQIVCKSTGICVGCEHNRSEANVIAKWMTDYHCKQYMVIANRVDLVKAAQEIRGGDVFQVKRRDSILQEMGAC